MRLIMPSGTGTVPTETRQYAPYGTHSQLLGSPQTEYGYTGEPLDGNGLIHLRARYYSPALGVFASLDPLETPNRYGYVLGNPVNDAVGELLSLINGYNYVGGNPVNRRDPSGMCWINDSSSSAQQTQCYDAWHGYTDLIAYTYTQNWPRDVRILVTQEARYWGNLSYGEFVSQWNSSRPSASTDPGGDVLQSSLPVLGGISFANPAPGPEDLIALGGLCIAGIWAIAANAGAITLPNRPIINFGASGATTQTFPLVLESSNFDWSTMERDAADAIERVLHASTFRLLYRGTALGRALSRTGLHAGLLWLSESLSYTTIYAHTDAAAERDTAAISIYGVLNAVLAALIASGNVQTRFGGGLEYGFDTIAQVSLAGPVVIPIPDSFRE